jgi:hypothetical protein
MAQERFYACEVCWRDNAFDFAEEVLTPLRLKEREAKRLFRSLTCPRCESPVDPLTRLVTPTDEEVRYTIIARRFDKLHRDDLIEFRSFLIRYPMLGLTKPFGEVLLKAMKKARKPVLEPRIWHHATRNLDGPALVPRTQQRASRAGRFNQIGQMVIYLGADEKTAAVEVLREPIAGERIRIAAVELHEHLTVLDLRMVIGVGDPAGHWILRNVVDRRFISEPTDDTDESRPQYRLPQFVADLARSRGFQGILYQSTRPSAYNNPDTFGGDNLVIFYPFPRYTVRPDSVFEFAEPDYDPWATERWILQRVLVNSC